MTDHQLLGISGSLRAAATNRLLLREAARLYGPATYTEADINLPLYNGDVEDRGMPEKVVTLAAQIRAADAVIISSPEYNSSLSGVLKNALDWISRVKGGVWRDKPLAIMSAADGRAGGARAQFALRLCLVPFRPALMPGPEVLLADSSNGFDATGQLTDPRMARNLTDLMQGLKAQV